MCSLITFNKIEREGFKVVVKEDTVKDEIIIAVISINDNWPVYTKRYSVAEYYHLCSFNPKSFEESFTKEVLNFLDSFTTEKEKDILHGNNNSPKFMDLILLGVDIQTTRHSLDDQTVQLQFSYKELHMKEIIKLDLIRKEYRFSKLFETQMTLKVLGYFALSHRV